MLTRQPNVCFQVPDVTKATMVSFELHDAVSQRTASHRDCNVIAIADYCHCQTGRRETQSKDRGPSQISSQAALEWLRISPWLSTAAKPHRVERSQHALSRPVRAALLALRAAQVWMGRSWILSRALEWRQLRSMLDFDPNRNDLELRAIEALDLLDAMQHP